ncbi:hypothetical protein ABIA38_007392 [Embleya sp. AB8]
MTAEAAGVVIEASDSKISRLENGKADLKRLEISALLQAYGADPAMTTQVLEMAEEARKPDWWADESSVIPSGLGTLIDVESSATNLRAFNSMIVLGMLQTEDYARATITAHCPDEPEDVIEGRVRLRMRRQTILEQASPPQLEVILDEAALRREVGGPDVMRKQIEHLVDVSRRPQITIRLIPYSAGAHKGQMGSYLLLSFPDAGDPDVVYSDGLLGNTFVEKKHQVASFASLFEQLRSIALNPVDTERFLLGILKGPSA